MDAGGSRHSTGMSAQKHHSKHDVAKDIPKYRESTMGRAVKVYTVNLESKYLLVQNVHALGVTKELLELFSLYGRIVEYIILDEYPCEEFCDAYWIKFFSISSARIAKQKLDNKSFYGKLLHVSYAPESEEVTDVREKLVERKQCVLQKTEGTSKIEYSTLKHDDISTNTEPQATVKKRRRI